MTTALITGATGQDGSYLVEALVARGDDVHALIRGTVLDGETPLPGGVAVHTADLADSASIRRVMDEVEPELVVNLGGISSVAASWDDPATTARISGMAAIDLMDAAWRMGERRGRTIRFIQASSAEIFGRAAEIPQNEHTPVDPVSPYGAAKAVAHRMVGIYRAKGLAASAAILYNHESPRRPPAFVTRKITIGAARIALGLESTLTLGNLDARRDWGWAPDYVDAMLRMTAADPDDFVVATGTAHTVRDFVVSAFRAAGVEGGEERIRIDERFIRPDDAPVQIGDASRIRQRLDWAPTTTFDEIVSRMVAAELASLAG